MMNNSDDLGQIEVETKEFIPSFSELILAAKLYKKSKDENKWKEWKPFVFVSSLLLFLAGLPLILIAILFPDQRLEIVRVLFGLSKIFLGLILFGGLLGVLVWIIAVSTGWIIFKLKNPRIPKTVATFTPDGIEFTQGQRNLKIEWSSYRSVIEHRRMFLLLRNEKLFDVLPKRALELEQIQTLKEMFNEKIGKVIVKNGRLRSRASGPPAC